MSERIYLYPKWVRLWHIMNAIACLLLILSGFSMQYAAPGRMLMPLDIAVKMHNYLGLLLSFNYLIFLIGNTVTSNGKHYAIKDRSFLNSVMQQFQFYTFGIFKNVKKPFPVTAERKFNPLQQITYISAMYCLIPVVVITGITMLNPLIFEKKISFLTMDIIHIVAGFLISVFLVIHIYFSTIGFKSNYKAISSGWHEEE